jgi:hypothetical protein
MALRIVSSEGDSPHCPARCSRSMNATRIAARDALAEVLGNLGLSYRVTEEGKLFITTATRLAEDPGKKAG